MRILAIDDASHHYDTWDDHDDCDDNDDYSNQSDYDHDPCWLPGMVLGFCFQSRPLLLLGCGMVPLQPGCISSEPDFDKNFMMIIMIIMTIGMIIMIGMTMIMWHGPTPARLYFLRAWFYYDYKYDYHDYLIMITIIIMIMMIMINMIILGCGMVPLQPGCIFFEPDFIMIIMTMVIIMTIMIMMIMMIMINMMIVMIMMIGMIMIMFMLNMMISNSLIPNWLSEGGAEWKFEVQRSDGKKFRMFSALI